MNRLYAITDDVSATTIGLVEENNIEPFIMHYCFHKGTDTGYFFYQIFIVDEDNNFIPNSVHPIVLYKNVFYYEDQMLPNGKVVS